MNAFKPKDIPSVAAAEADQARAEVEVKTEERLAAIESEVNWLDVSAMMTHIPAPLDFVFPGMLAGTVASLVSPGGAGKSFLALELAALIASGVDVAGLTGKGGWNTTPDKGNVLYIALEDTPQGVRWKRA